MEVSYVVNHPQTLAAFLQHHRVSQSLMHGYPTTLQAHCNHQLLALNDLLSPNDVIILTFSKEANTIPPLHYPLTIIYEDDYLLVVDKPPYLATLGTGSHYSYNLAGMVSAYYQQQGIQSKIHFVNRLDKDTQGLTLLAKHQYIHALLSHPTPIEKKYRALVQGHLLEKKGWITHPISRLAPPSTKRIIHPQGQSAFTYYEVISTINENSLVELTLYSGRTHQIRVHLSSIGHPLVNDELYGLKSEGKFYLQSFYLAFQHPITNKPMQFTLPLRF